MDSIKIRAVAVGSIALTVAAAACASSVTHEEPVMRAQEADFNPGILEDGFGHNGLSGHSLNHNALTMNKAALKTLVSNPLDSSLFDAMANPHMNAMLRDPAARDVLEEIVDAVGVSALVAATQEVLDADPGRDRGRG
jgi:hypothetical protein